MMDLSTLPPSAIVSGGNPKKYHAQLKLRRFLNAHQIKRPFTCPLCNKTKPVDTHHPDYEYPETFIWACRSCHMKIHAGTLTLLDYPGAKIYPLGHWESFWTTPANRPILAQAYKKYIGRIPDWFVEKYPEFDLRPDLKEIVMESL